MPSSTRSGVVVDIDGCDYDIEDLVAVAVAAELLGQSVDTVRRRVAAGELPAVKVGPPPTDPTRDRRRIKIPLPAIAALLRPVEGVAS